MSHEVPDTAVDETDRHILQQLWQNGRMSNKDLASAVGIPPSTCLLRVRRLVSRNIIRGFHADINPDLLGRPLQAMVSVQLKVHTKEVNDRFMSKLVQLPGVLSVALMAGKDDYLVHVASATPSTIKEFVLNSITSDPAVAKSYTRLIFQHVTVGGAWRK